MQEVSSTAQSKACPLRTAVDKPLRFLYKVWMHSAATQFPDYFELQKDDKSVQQTKVGAD